MKGFTVAIVLLALAAPLRGQTFPASLAGRWASAPLELALTSDFHQSVYGAGARSVRSVTMNIQPSGESVFTVTSSVRDRKGIVVAGTREVEEVRFAIGDLVEESGRPPHYATRIVHAERRFADDPASTFARDGVKLAIHVLEDKAGALEVRFDTPEGPGSFWETLHRVASPARRP